MNHLVLDLGNTSLKAACFQERTMLKSISSSWVNSDEIEEALLRLMVYNPTNVFISSVAGSRKEVDLFLKRAQLKAMFLDSGTSIPIRAICTEIKILTLDSLCFMESKIRFRSSRVKLRRLPVG